MYLHHLMGKRTYHYRNIYRQSNPWLKKLKSFRIVEKQAYKKVHYERFRRSQKDYWIGDNLREKYLQNWLNDLLKSKKMTLYHPTILPVKAGCTLILDQAKNH